MITNFDTIIDRTESMAIKYSALQKVFGRNDILPMWVADMDFASPKFIIDALKRRLEHPILGYTTRPATFYLAYKNWCKIRYNWDINLEWLTFSPGVVSALALSLLAFTDPLDKIIIQPPVYPPFFKTVEGLGRKLIINPLKKDEYGRYTMDFNDLIKKIDSQTKLIIISNPHNPVGRAWTEKELIKLGNIALDNNMIIVSDDIHADFIYKGYKYTPIAKISKQIASRTIIAASPSKTFNIPGLSTSVVVIPEETLREKYNQKLNSAHLWLGNIFGNIAFEAAYTKGAEWLDRLLEYLERNVDYVVNFINNYVPKVKVWRPEATFLLWIDFSDTGLKHEEIRNKLINEARLGLNDGLNFGEQGRFFFRMNIGAPYSIVRQATENLAKFFTK